MANTGNSFGVHLHHETRDGGSRGCDENNNSTPINPNIFYSGFQIGSIELVSAEEADLVQSEEQIDLPEDVFYSTEEVLAMTKEERESKEIPEPL